jgi:hypothetical protein
MLVHPGWRRRVARLVTYRRDPALPDTRLFGSCIERDSPLCRTQLKSLRGIFPRVPAALLQGIWLCRSVILRPRMCVDISMADPVAFVTERLN